MTWNHGQDNYENFNVSFFDSIHLINQLHWNRVLEEENVYLSLSYLKSLEESLKNSISFRYMIFYDNKNNPVGIAVTQILDFVDKFRKYDEALCEIGSKIKNKLLGVRDIKVMVCGNVFACGENGFKFIEGTLPDIQLFNLTKALVRLRKSEKVNGNISMTLLKEFWPESFSKLDLVRNDEYREFMIDVNMVLKLHSSWTSFDNYLESMKAKFRTKANNAFKKSNEVVVKSLSPNEILHLKQEIEKLYESVLKNADFKFGELNGNTFAALKDNLGDNFVFKGFFLKDELIGFSTAYCYNQLIDAGYVGINYNYNLSLALYQRILYEYVIEAISKGAKELRFGRTAEEIKSTLGAEPVDMKLFVKHRNVVSNVLIKPIIESIVPSNFELRSPFKIDFISG